MKSNGQRQPPGENKPHKYHIQCHNCKRFGHVKADCWFRDKGANITKEQGTSNLFIAKQGVKCEDNTVWLVDNGARII